MRNEKVLNRNFEELTLYEVNEVNGGMAPAALYALGFVFGCSPAGAIAICVGAVAAGVGIAVAAN